MKHYSTLPLLALFDIDWEAGVEYVVEAVVCAFKTIFYWVIDALLALLEPAFESALESFPESPSSISNTLNVFSYGNYLLPISESISLFSAFLLFLATYSAIKIVVKLIPTVG